MAIDAKKLGGAACCGISSLLFLILGIWAVTEKNKFDPFYTPMQATSLFLELPISPAMYTAATSPSMSALPAQQQVLPTFVGFASMTDFAAQTPTLTVGLDTSMGGPIVGAPWSGSTVTPMQVGNVNVTVDQALGGLGLPAGGMLLQAVSPAAYAACGLLPAIKVLIKNPNEMGVTVRGGSGGNFEMYNGSNFIDIGDFAVIGDVTADPKGSLTLTLGVKLQIPAPFLAALGKAPPGQEIMFLTFTKLKTTTTAKLMGVEH